MCVYCELSIDCVVCGLYSLIHRLLPNSLYSMGQTVGEEPVKKLVVAVADQGSCMT